MVRILVVDDEPKLGRVVQQMLEMDGHAVSRAADASTSSSLESRSSGTERHGTERQSSAADQAAGAKDSPTATPCPDSNPGSCPR